MLSTNLSNHLDYNSPNNTFTTSSNSSSGSSPSSSTSTSYNPSSNSGALGENSAVSYSASNSNKILKRSKKQKKQTPPEKRRVRTGCLTCRSKHKKCDETKPICEFCKAKNLQCIWPKEGMTRPSQLNDTLKQLISLQKQQPQSQAQAEAQAQTQPQSHPQLQFQAPSQPNIQSRGQSLSLPSLDYIQDSSFDQLLFPQLQVSTAPSTNSRKVNYLKLPTNFPSLLSIIPAIQAGTLSLTSHSFIFFNDKHPSVKNSIFSNSLTSLLSNYFITDPAYLLHLKNPHHILSLSRDYKPLTYSILAISSRILEQFDESYNGENTIDFYTLSVRELSKSLREGIHGILKESIRGKECIWWTVVLLGWFEILSLKPTDSWERLHGILEFFETLGILGINDNMEPLIGLLIISFGSYSFKKKKKSIKNNDSNGNGNEGNENENEKENDDNVIRNEINSDNKINNDNENNNENDNDNDNNDENFNDLNLIQNFKHLTNKNNNEVLNILCKILLNKVADDINEWVEIWNMLLDWKLRSSTDYDSYTQDDGKIIFSIDKILFNNLLYHVSCHYMLKNKPTNISLVYQNLSDPTSVVAFAMCQDMNELDELINWHKDKLVRIIESNMANKTEKSTYCLLACWFCCLTLMNDKNFDKITVGIVLKKMENWSGMCFVSWLVDNYTH